ncbi:MAG: antibiotic biosynthesis monooxygenase [Bacteroidales bacterium]|nr:antibiotic biosynthesis monooxygenase [Bacteroidales bacterium]
MKKNLFVSLIGLLTLVLLTGSSMGDVSSKESDHDKDSMRVVMRFELKVKPESVALLKQSFDACKVEVLAKEPGCLEYSLFQSYNDSTLFCITETWATKADHNAHMQLEHTKNHLAETKGIRDPTFKSTTSYMYWVCPGVNEVK